LQNSRLKKRNQKKSTGLYLIFLDLKNHAFHFFKYQRVLYILFQKGVREECRFQGVKSVRENQKRTKKMSFFQKRRPFHENTFFKTRSEHNALKCKKKEENVVMIKFILFS
jgi:hypothetical protein